MTGVAGLNSESPFLMCAAMRLDSEGHQPCLSSRDFTAASKTRRRDPCFLTRDLEKPSLLTPSCALDAPAGRSSRSPHAGSSGCMTPTPATVHHTLPHFPICLHPTDLGQEHAAPGTLSLSSVRRAPYDSSGHLTETHRPARMQD